MAERRYPYPIVCPSKECEQVIAQRLEGIVMSRSIVTGVTKTGRMLVQCGSCQQMIVIQPVVPTNGKPEAAVARQVKHKRVSTEMQA